MSAPRNVLGIGDPFLPGAMPMSINELLAEMWAVHQVFRALRFEPGEIWIAGDALSPDGRRKCIAVLVKRADQEFAIAMPDVKGASPDDVIKAWPNYAVRMNAASRLVMKTVYQSTLVYREIAALVVGMMARGGMVADAVVKYGNSLLN